MRAILMRRIATPIPTLLTVILLSFVLMRAAPGNPFDAELTPADRAARVIAALETVELGAESPIAARGSYRADRRSVLR